MTPPRTRIVPAAATLLLLAAASPLATAAEQSLTLVSGKAGDDLVWTDADGAINPILTVNAGANVTLTIRQSEASDGIVHRIRAGGDASEAIVTAGDTAQVSFIAPAAGSLPYECPIHPGTMRGTLAVTASAPEESRESSRIPFGGLALLLASVLLALAHHPKRPRIHR